MTEEIKEGRTITWTFNKVVICVRIVHFDRVGLKGHSSSTISFIIFLYNDSNHQLQYNMISCLYGHQLWAHISYKSIWYFFILCYQIGIAFRIYIYRQV